MSEKDSELTLESIETVEFISTCFMRYAELLSSLPGKYEDNRLDKLMFLPWGIASNSKAIYLLGKNSFGNEVFVLLRGLMEKIITFYYLQICDGEEFENYIKYSKQKSIWKMNRSLSAGDRSIKFEMKGGINIDDFPDLKEAKDQFTSSKGRSLTRWSPTSIEKKLEAIEKAGEISTEFMLIATVSYYDDGSEALHATMYGCLFHIGAMGPERPPRSPEELVDKHHASLSAMFFSMALILEQLLKYIASKAEIDDVKSQTNQVAKDVENFMKPVLGLESKK